MNPHKPKKVRRVLKGAAKCHKQSLNNAPLTGPDLLQNLLHVLIRFREFRFAVSADIEAMFLQVGVLPPDQPSLRFLWREAPANKIVVFHTFSGLKTRRRVLIMHYAVQLPTTNLRTPTQLLLSKRSSTFGRLS